MNQNFKADERELIKVATFFKKQSKKLMEEGRLGPENQQVAEAVDKFIAHIEEHANRRDQLHKERDMIGKLVKDNAQCPRCHTSDKIKLVGTEKNEKGWKSNRYKCRKCNIQFTWNRPNNPSDMVRYIEELTTVLEVKSAAPETPEEERQQMANTIHAMNENLGKLKPIIEAHDREFEMLHARDEEMAKAVHEFKNTLLIEKIKMDTWENKKK